MASHREQAHLEAPIEAVWELVGNPARYGEWWPRMIEVRGESFEAGTEFVLVGQEFGGGRFERPQLIESREELRTLHMTCQDTGTFARWSLTPAQGGTFVELNQGIDNPIGLGTRVFNSTPLARRFFRRWAEQAVASLREAAAREARQGEQPEQETAPR